jgi:hypothetical protein
MRLSLSAGFAFTTKFRSRFRRGSIHWRGFRSTENTALGYIKRVIGNRLQFASTADDRTGWSQMAASLESRALI